MNFTSSDLEYTYLNIATWVSSSDVQLTSTFSPIANEVETRFAFKYCAQTKGISKYSAQSLCKDVTVVLGCFSETSMTATVKGLPTVAAGSYQEVFQQPESLIPGNSINPHAKIRIKTPASTVRTFNLTELISWTTDVSLCFASNVSMYSDLALTTLYTGPDVYLSSNPTNKDLSGLVDPQLNVNAAVAFNKLVYLKGSTNSGAVYDVFRLNVIVCGQEQVSLSADSSVSARQ